MPSRRPVAATTGGKRRPDGRFVRSYTDRAGRRRYVYGATTAEVGERLILAKADTIRGVAQPLRTDTVAAWLDDWFRGSVEPSQRRTKTKALYRWAAARVSAAIGTIRLADLSPQQVQTYLVNELQLLAPGSVVDIRTVLNQSLTLAEAWGKIARNPLALIDRSVLRACYHRGDDEADERPIIGVDFGKTLLRLFRTDELGALYTTTLLCGLRMMEALGLQWRDVDLEAGTLYVRYQLLRSEGRWHRAPVKTRGSRARLPLPPVVAEVLRDHRARQAEWRTFYGSGWNEGDWVFTRDNGEPLSDKMVRARWRAFLKHHRLPEMKYHLLRHGTADLLIALGTPPRVAMTLMRHATNRMTMEVYQRVGPELESEAVGLLSSALRETGA